MALLTVSIGVSCFGNQLLSRPVLSCEPYRSHANYPLHQCHILLFLLQTMLPALNHRPDLNTHQIDRLKVRSKSLLKVAELILLPVLVQSTQALKTYSPSGSARLCWAWYRGGEKRTVTYERAALYPKRCHQQTLFAHKSGFYEGKMLSWGNCVVMITTISFHGFKLVSYRLKRSSLSRVNLLTGC